ncbi:hypothetical protein KL942_002300 [Ogataea angusta]|uniref:Lysophospholipid acyltransferase n=1 Tax=Pichia angusta TaxID=870730 RepID=A0ABQ7RYS7_PICAN|nr:hypothetical protein KL942_002300 [Ogataea angusta]KAG7850257.1 hypothetical protein KL940_001817 [Ogataea angusta]KAG7860475.1 hypothetical protein KL939_001961 [Ogataea angusta]
MYNPFQLAIAKFSGLSGLDEGSCRILTCLFLSFPLSAIFKRIPDQKVHFKNYYIIAVSAVYIFLILEIWSGFFVLLFNALFTFVLVKYYKSRLMPWVNLIALMLFLCVNHLKAQFFAPDYDPSAIDITGAQMVLVMKLSSFGWSISDGQLYHEDIDKFNQLNTYQKSRAILNYPPILYYLGYVFFYGSLVTGPSFDYSDYEKFILTDIFNDVPLEKRPGRYSKRKIPRSGRVALKRVAQGAFWAVLWIYIKPIITLDYALSFEFTQQSFFYKIIFLWILGIVHRMKYYSVWSISEAGCIVAGLGYNGYDPKTGKMYWNRVQNIDPYAFETGQNVHDCLEAWNMNTNKWLKNYIYLRTCKRDPKTGQMKPGMLPTFLTFFTSAFWHGTMPGYYMTFIIGAFMQTVGKIFRRNLRPIFCSKDGSNVSKYKFLYDIIGWFITQSAFGYIVQPFMILRFVPSFNLWKTCYFWVHICCVATIGFFDSPLGKQASKKLQNYHLQPIKATKVQDKEVSLAQLREHYNSATDLHDIVRKLPEFDNQEELQVENVVVPDIQEIKDNYDKLTKEVDEWVKANENAAVDKAEIDAVHSALANIEKDVRSYLESKKED